MAVVRILLALVMTLARVIPFLLVALVVFLLWRRSRRQGDGPDFKGPVVTVDYEVVDDGGDGDGADGKEGRT